MEIIPWCLQTKYDTFGQIKFHKESYFVELIFKLFLFNFVEKYFEKCAKKRIKKNIV